MRARWWTHEVGGAPLWVIGIAGACAVALVAGAVALRIDRNPEAHPGSANSLGQDDLGAVAPTVVVLGDSYAAGAGASEANKRWVSQVAAEEGWDLTNLARGGTGFLTPVTGALAESACGREECPSFEEMAKKGSALKPDLVVVSGGRNNAGLSATDAKAAIVRFFESLPELYPDAEIVVTNALWDDAAPPPALDVINTALQAASKGIGAEFIDIGEPLRGHPDRVASDGIHPNDRGHAAIAAAVIAALP